MELLTEEIHQIFADLAPAEPAVPLSALGFEPLSDLVEEFTFRPGYFARGGELGE